MSVCVEREGISQKKSVVVISAAEQRRIHVWEAVVLGLSKYLFLLIRWMKHCRIVFKNELTFTTNAFCLRIITIIKCPQVIRVTKFKSVLAHSKIRCLGESLLCLFPNLDFPVFKKYCLTSHFYHANHSPFNRVSKLIFLSCAGYCDPSH